MQRSQTQNRSWAYRLFRAHPSDVDETYLQHMGAAFGFSALLLKLAVAALAHGILPCCHKTTVSDRIIKLAEDMTARRQSKAS